MTVDRTPRWAWAWPVLAWVVLASTTVLTVGGVLAAVADVVLVATVFAAVYHAEVVAHRTGEPFGTLVLAVAVTVIVCWPLMSERSHSNGGALDSAERPCGITLTSTLASLQSSRASTLTTKSWFTCAPFAGSMMATPGAASSSMHPNADGLGPPGHAPMVPFTISYEFWVTRSQRSPAR